VLNYYIFKEVRKLQVSQQMQKPLQPKIKIKEVFFCLLACSGNLIAESLINPSGK